MTSGSMRILTSMSPTSLMIDGVVHFYLLVYLDRKRARGECA